MATVFDDLPTLDDKLGWNSELGYLTERILECETPHVIGIHGDWGSGKTSLMRQVQWELGGDMPEDGSVSKIKRARNHQDRNARRESIATVWFDAWRYQNEPAPVVALLNEMRQQLTSLPKVRQKLKKTASIVVRSVLDGFSNVGKTIGMEAIPSAEQIEKYGERWELSHFAQTAETDSIRAHLRDTIKYLLPDEDRGRVVVFIDDLDRCNPAAAIRLLEGLKIYLSIPNCVFVLGMNERILVDALAEALSTPKEATREELKLIASHYLEKICSDLYRLPLPVDPGQLLGQWLPNGRQRDALMAAIAGVACLPPNPRRLKALANQWTRFAARVPFPGDNEVRRVWAVRTLVAAYIHLFHRDLWERWHFKPDFWNAIKAFVAGGIRIKDDDRQAGAQAAYSWAQTL